MDATSTLVAIAGAFLLAGFVKGVIGLGLPTISIGLPGLLMTPAQAAAVLVGVSCHEYLASSGRRRSSWTGAAIVAAACRNLYRDRRWRGLAAA
jgi:uncharacterized membrane protein YfcA